MKNVLIKISGEYFQNESESLSMLNNTNLASVVFMTGGGNIIRGSHVMKRTSYVDNAGMASTLVNSFLLANILSTPTCVMSNTFSGNGLERYNPYLIMHNRASVSYILAAGVGCGYLSTDTAMVIRALEVNSDVCIKVTKVGGIFDKDPKYNSDAKLISMMKYKKCAAYDDVAITIAENNNMPIFVMDLYNLFLYLKDKDFIGTIIGNQDTY